MSKPNIKKLVNQARAALSRRAPEILTGIGIAGMVSTTVLAVKATPKAVRLIDERKAELETEKIPVGEVVKTTWKCYIPAAVTCAASMACLIGATSVNTRRTTALATAYKLSESALAEYKDAVVETIGEEKERKIRDNMNQKRIDNNPVSSSEIFVTKAGETLCYDVFSGRYFKSDIDTIKAVVNELNRQLLLENYISMSDFYDEIDLPHTKTSDELGWNIDDGLIDIDFSARLADDGKPCIVIDYRVPPRYDFNKFS